MTTPAKLDEHQLRREPTRELLERLGYGYVPSEAAVHQK